MTFLSPYSLSSHIKTTLDHHLDLHLQYHFFSTMDFLLEEGKKAIKNHPIKKEIYGHNNHGDNISFVVGVSGGSDSIALCKLMIPWCKKNHYTLYPLVMDHQLFPGSKEELQEIVDLLSSWGLRVYQSSWNAPQDFKARGLMDKARCWRYGEAKKIAALHHTPFFITGHHEEENQEVYYMRQGQGASFYGKGGMSLIAWQDGLLLLRPLLAYGKTLLQTFLKNQKQFWLEDPCNHNIAYKRNAWRFVKQNIPSLVEEYNKNLVFFSLRREKYSKKIEQHIFFLKKTTKTQNEIYIVLSEDFPQFSEEEGISFLYFLCSLYHHKPPRYKKICQLWHYIVGLLKNNNQEQKKNIYVGSLGHGALHIKSLESLVKKYPELQESFRYSFVPWKKVFLFLPLLPREERRKNIVNIPQDHTA